jgi:hypothetical protein
MAFATLKMISSPKRTQKATPPLEDILLPAPPEAAGKRNMPWWTA